MAAGLFEESGGVFELSIGLVPAMVGLGESGHLRDAQAGLASRQRGQGPP